METSLQLLQRNGDVAPEEIASGKLRRLSAHGQTFECKGVKSQWPGPAVILGLEETDIVAKSRGQTFKAARDCVRRTPKLKNVRDVGWKLLSSGSCVGCVRSTAWETFSCAGLRARDLQPSLGSAGSRASDT